jgi:hypothetical protein
MIAFLNQFATHCLADMQELKCVHTDLKPENMLFFFVSSDCVKVPDCNAFTRSVVTDYV